jgi:hypothetical protein
VSILIQFYALITVCFLLFKNIFTSVLTIKNGGSTRCGEQNWNFEYGYGVENLWWRWFCSHKIAIIIFCPLFLSLSLSSTMPDAFVICVKWEKRCFIIFLEAKTLTTTFWRHCNYSYSILMSSLLSTFFPAHYQCSHRPKPFVSNSVDLIVFESLIQYARVILQISHYFW